MKRIEIFYQDNIYSLAESGKFNLIVNNQTRTIISKIKKRLEADANTAFLIFFSGFESFQTKALQKFLKKQRIKKIYVFFEDVFRITTNKLYQEDFNIIEIEILKQILHKTKINDVTIFHCEKNCKAVEKRYNLSINYFDWFFLEICLNGHDYSSSKNKIHKKVSCFNLRPDWHRTYLGLLLFESIDSIVSLNYNVDKKLYYTQQEFPFKNLDIDLQKRINDAHQNLDYSKVLLDVKHNELSKDGTVNLSANQQWNNLRYMERAFANVVTETRFYSPMPYITEKTIKPMILKRPFILAAPPYSLHLLHELGFKTFSEYWDESYDEIENHALRLKKIYIICNQITSLSYNDLDIMLTDMDSILEHNKKHIKKIPKRMLNYLNKVYPSFLQ